MAADWALVFFGPAGDTHASIFLLALWLSVLLGALKMDDNITVSWWTVMAPLVSSASLSLYLYFIVSVRLRMDPRILARRMVKHTILPVMLSADLLVLWILFGAALSDFSRLSPFEASIPVVGILGLTPWLPSGPR